MKKIIVILFLVASGFNFSDTNAGNNSIGVHTGSISLGGSRYSTLGLIYENRFSDSFGFTAAYDTYEYRYGEKRSIRILGINYYPINNLQLGLGFGNETRSVGNATGARASIGYAIDFDKIIITPSYRIYGSAKEIGVAIQLKF
ncbi:MAG: hypothetical protein Q9M92_00450 [Enterobacterales bacterium]|nr:hypothetical protein [Enterobacterales bacterium]